MWLGWLAANVARQAGAISLLNKVDVQLYQTARSSARARPKEGEIDFPSLICNILPIVMGQEMKLEIKIEIKLN